MNNYFKNKLYLSKKGKPSPTKMTERYIKEKYPIEYKELMNFIKENLIDDHLFSRSIWHYINGISLPECKHCKDTHSRWLSFGKGYQDFCSRKCSLTYMNKSKEHKEKIKETNLERYGVEHCNQRKEIQEKRGNTLKNKYGVINVSQIKKVKEKKKETNLEKRGFEYSLQDPKIRKQIEKTNIKKYGFKNVFQNDNIKEKIKESLIAKYGVEHPMDSDSIRNKLKNTNLERYGVEHAMQVPEFFNRQQKSAFKRFKYKNTNIHYQGTYELDFLDSFDNLIKIENGPSVKYVLNKSNKVYYSDFYLPVHNLIVEIKSCWTYERDLEMNLEKQKACIEQGYNFMFIINKDYSKLEEIII